MRLGRHAAGAPNSSARIQTHKYVYIFMRARCERLFSFFFFTPSVFFLFVHFIFFFVCVYYAFIVGWTHAVDVGIELPQCVDMGAWGGHAFSNSVDHGLNASIPRSDRMPLGPCLPYASNYHYALCLVAPVLMVRPASICNTWKDKNLMHATKCFNRQTDWSASSGPHTQQFQIFFKEACAMLDHERMLISVTRQKTQV